MILLFIYIWSNILNQNVPMIHINNNVIFLLYQQHIFPFLHLYIVHLSYDVEHNNWLKIYIYFLIFYLYLTSNFCSFFPFFCFLPFLSLPPTFLFVYNYYPLYVFLMKHYYHLLMLSELTNYRESL